MFAGFDRSSGGIYQFEEKISWISAINANYHVGVDGISLQWCADRFLAYGCPHFWKDITVLKNILLGCCCWSPVY